jgi:hypothetical protein
MKPAVSMILKNGLEEWSLAIATERFLWVGLQCDQRGSGEEKARLSDLAVSAGEIWGFNSPIGLFSVVRVALFGSLGVSPQRKILGTAYEAFDDTVDSPVWQDGARKWGRTMGPRSTPTLTVRLLKQRRDELLGELRVVAPDLVQKLEQTLEALTEQRPERGEYDGLDRPAVIRKYLLKVRRPTGLREIRDAVASPASRFDRRSIWDGGKREVEQGRLLNVADESKGQDWVLSLPEWVQRNVKAR